jgi:hypothetical protein
MNDSQPDVVNGEHVAAGLLRKLLILSIHGLLICGSSYEVDLASKGDAARDDGSSLVVKVKELNKSLIDARPYRSDIETDQQENTPFLTGPPFDPSTDQ